MHGDVSLNTIYSGNRSQWHIPISFLTKQIELKIPELLQDFMEDLNDLSVPTRYPDELESLLKQYKKDKTEKILIQTKELLLWLKEKL